MQRLRVERLTRRAPAASAERRFVASGCYASEDIGFLLSTLRVGLRKLRMLDAATTLEDRSIPPANRLQKLRGDRAGQWSIRINDRWRVCFVWRDGHAYDVEIVEYH